MLDQLDLMEKEALAALETIQNGDALADWNRCYLGKKGALTLLLRSVRELPQEERPAFGRAANEVKNALEAAYEAREQALRRAELERELERGALDVTLPGRPVGPGHLHITTQTLRQIYAIFAEMGFQVYEAPEVETDELNFGLLNMPPHHPARDMWDTFWVGEETLLRTHTSPGQVRVMRERYPEPIRVILPGKCYRYEQITARSEHQFYQVEGLAVGHGIALTDLIGTLTEFARRLYGPERKIRIRGSYFPFTEPSIEADMDCILCNGECASTAAGWRWAERGWCTRWCWRTAATTPPSGAALPLAWGSSGPLCSSTTLTISACSMGTICGS